ncbi:hypothetical protein DY000_02044636 [Brassica cretica]|uniref:DUF4219 domain-containing protein n=1 Tax=Brassica cretica TaxID=69181 RepID=A0ABQ7EZS8_BRACR|nr:hypothetical protein DY000_02044636 [Brassica cretica]
MYTWRTCRKKVERSLFGACVIKPLVSLLCARKKDRVCDGGISRGNVYDKTPRLDSSNYGYWKVRMQAFISGLDEDCWSSIEAGWSHPVMLNDEKVEVLKPRDQWTASEKRASSCNSKAKTAIYNANDASYFKLISQCADVVGEVLPRSWKIEV